MMFVRNFEVRLITYLVIDSRSLVGQDQYKGLGLQQKLN